MALLDPRLESALAKSAADETAPATPWWQSSRILGLGFVAALHVGLIAFILSSLPVQIPRLPAVAERETFFLFPPPKPARLPQRIELPHRVAIEPYFHASPPSTPDPRPKATNGLGLALFGCAPETLANLTPEERAHCGSDASFEAAADSETLPGVLREQAHTADRWKAAVAQRDAAMPCVHLEDLAAPQGRTDQVAVADPLCLLKQIEDGGAR
jgi:hypothetical protein